MKRRLRAPPNDGAERKRKATKCAALFAFGVSALSARLPCRSRGVDKAEKRENNSSASSICASSRETGMEMEMKTAMEREMELKLELELGLGLGLELGLALALELGSELELELELGMERARRRHCGPAGWWEATQFGRPIGRGRQFEMNLSNSRSLAAPDNYRLFGARRSAKETNTCPRREGTLKRTQKRLLGPRAASRKPRALSAGRGIRRPSGKQ